MNTLSAILVILVAATLGCMLIAALIFLLAGNETPARDPVPRQQPSKLPEPLRTITESADAWWAWFDWWKTNRPNEVFVGRTRSGLLGSNTRLAMIVLGPPGAGKTMRVLVPQALLHDGPAVLVTTKDSDLYVPTAQTRARLGQLWHFNPGSGPLLPGCKELKLSPLHGAEVWDRAVEIAETLTNETLGKAEERGNDQFWRVTAADAVAVTLHAAALAGEDMRLVLNALSHDETAWRRIETVLFRADADEAIRSLRGLRDGDDPRTTSNVVTSARNVMLPYRKAHTFRTTQAHNFSAEDFARSKDTIYITANEDEQKALAPIIVFLLREIRRAQRAYHWECERAGKPSNPMFWGLDELASMAPLDNFPELVMQAGSSGLRITACLQDLSSAITKWGKQGEAILNYTTAVVFPGTLHKDVTALLSSVQGKTWVTKASHSSSQTVTNTDGWSRTVGHKETSDGTSGSTSTATTQGVSESHHHVDVATAHDIINGNAGIDKGGFGREGALLFSLGVITPLKPVALWETPFLHSLLSNAVYATRNFVDGRAMLPFPKLALTSRHLTVTQKREWVWAHVENSKTRELVAGEENEGD